MVSYKIVRVKPHKRGRKKVRGYRRKQLVHRGTFLNPQKKNSFHTMWIKDSSGHFKGRKRVSGRGDGTSIVREGKGRIIGRVKKRG